MAAHTLSVACLGAGYFSGYQHEAWQRIQDVTLIACCDTQLSRAQDVGVAAFADLEGMLATVSPDILDIITPTATHAQAIRSALAAGVATIICQKPFCESLSEAEDVVAAAADADATLVVHENFRFQPWFRVVNAAIQAGEIGEDADFILFEMDNEVRAMFDGNRHLDHASENPRLTFGEGLFEGTRGTLTIHGDGQVRKRVQGHMDDHVILPAQQWRGFAGDSVHAFQQHVISHLLTGSRLETAASDYLTTRRLEELVYRSSTEGRRLEMDNNRTVS